ncbi:unnamed protein product [Acanthoscelides obtectus]|uniref:Uncharacterized protein n=1 Tax=Acanthoscelides obtectus TaxID=200917 RepID=A0A9P0KPV3_ACAOB|nr:unnamed protein product [Acanthoscelides obtectus]CAK1664731.1 hypothetical protein AOBTE_LOCUS24437 [Acanthoscelides obtectus]
MHTVFSDIFGCVHIFGTFCMFEAFIAYKNLSSSSRNHLILKKSCTILFMAVVIYGIAVFFSWRILIPVDQ